MARTCDICNKRTEVGSQVCRRGIAKKKGGIGIASEVYRTLMATQERRGDIAPAAAETKS